jgi:CSLREA domain-containing protein
VANRNRRVALAATALTFMLVAMPGLARAATITVTTLADPTGAAGSCSLRNAITAANTQTATNNCTAGVGTTDTIVFETGLTGTIAIGNTGTLPAIVGGETLTITGPTTSGGITIIGDGAERLMVVNPAPLSTCNF